MKCVKVVLLLTLISTSSMASTEVLKATASDGSFRFVAAGDQGVYRSSDGKITIRCQYDSILRGVDDEANPYIALFYKCDEGKHIVLKTDIGTKKSGLSIADKKWNTLHQSGVTISK